MDTIRKCPFCGADATEHTFYISPESDVYEQKGDVHCVMCNNSWNEIDPAEYRGADYGDD